MHQRLCSSRAFSSLQVWKVVKAWFNNLHSIKIYEMITNEKFKIFKFLQQISNSDYKILIFYWKVYTLTLYRIIKKNSKQVIHSLKNFFQISWKRIVIFIFYILRLHSTNSPRKLRKNTQSFHLHIISTLNFSSARNLF